MRCLPPEFGSLSAAAERMYPAFGTAVTEVPNFRLGDTAAARAIGGHYHSSVDLCFLVLRAEPHLIWVRANARVKRKQLATALTGCAEERISTISETLTDLVPITQKHSATHRTVPSSQRQQKLHSGFYEVF